MRTRSIVSLALIVALAVAGVGGATLAAEKVKISIWHIFTDGAAKTLMDDLLAKYNKSQDRVEVDSLAVSFWDYWAKIGTAVAAGNGPDVALQDLSTAPARLKVNQVVPFNAFFKKSRINPKTEYFAQAMAAMEYKGEYAGVPCIPDTRIMFYNKAHFREAGLTKPPKTWSELEEYAAKLTKWAPNKKQLERIGFHPMWGNSSFLIWAWSNGAKILDKDGYPRLNQPKVMEALEWVAGWNKRYGITAIQAFAANNGTGMADPFISGRVSMVVQNVDFAQTLKDYAKDVEWGVCQIPYKAVPASWASGFDYEIPKRAANPHYEEAWKLIQYLTGAEVSMRFATEARLAPGNAKAVAKLAAAGDVIWQELYKAMKVSRFLDCVVEHPNWWYSSSGTIDEAINLTKTPQEALETAQKGIDTEIANYRKTH